MVIEPKRREFPGSVGAKRETKSQGSLNARENSLKRPRLLVIDDDLAIQEVLASALLVAGYRVDVSSSAIEALQLLEQSTYDLLLCDLRMPEMDGEGFLTALSYRDPDVAGKVVFMTGDSASKDTQRLLESTDRPVLIKPFTLSDLEDVVGHELRSRR